MIRVFEIYFIVNFVAISAEKKCCLWLEIYHRCLITIFYGWNVCSFDRSHKVMILENV